MRRELKQYAERDFAGMELGLDRLTCDPVEMIQGGEREVIVVSLTSSDPDHLAHHWRFTHCPRRFNVASTRAKAKLLVLASPHFFRFVPPNDDTTHHDGIGALQGWYLDRLD